MSEWISVEERLPETRKTHRDCSSTQVLVATKSIGVCIGSYHRNGTWMIGSFGHRDVTHWQPLPPPPQLGDRLQRAPIST